MSKGMKGSQITRFMGPTWAHLGPVGPRWAPYWLHEPCYQGCCHGHSHSWRHHDMETPSAPVDSHTNSQQCPAVTFSVVLVGIRCWTNNWVVSNFRHPNAHVTVMLIALSICLRVDITCLQVTLSHGPDWYLVQPQILHWSWNKPY